MENDVRQICHTGKSRKKEKPGYVGEKGIGFKSVFQIASRVQIQSNAFSFSFDYSGGPSSDEKLGYAAQRVPIGTRHIFRLYPWVR